MVDPQARPIIDLISELAQDIPALMRKEMLLARAEARTALTLSVSALRRLMIGLALGVGAIGLGLAAMVTSLTAFLVNRGVDPANASMFSTIAVMLMAALVAWLLLSSAMREFEAAKGSLDDSVSTLAGSLTGGAGDSNAG